MASWPDRWIYYSQIQLYVTALNSKLIWILYYSILNSNPEVKMNELTSWTILLELQYVIISWNGYDRFNIHNNELNDIYLIIAVVITRTITVFSTIRGRRLTKKHLGSFVVKIIISLSINNSIWKWGIRYWIYNNSNKYIIFPLHQDELWNVLCLF